MNRTLSAPPSVGVFLALAMAAPGAVLAYDEQDAIRDCEGRLRSEYKLSDLRDARAERLTDIPHHYKVQGQTKIDGNKHPWTCEVKNRHVTAAEYNGPKPQGLDTAQKLAIGTAAVVGGAIAVNELTKHGGASQASTNQSTAGAAGARELQDLVGARGSSGESALEGRGYSYASGSKSGGSSYTNYRKGSHCVTVRTANGRYTSIVDAPMADCEGGSKSGGNQSSGGGSGAADLQDLVGARAAGGESQMQSRGYSFVTASKKGGSAYAKWSNGRQCVTVRTTDGHYKSIVNTPIAQCK